MNGIFEFRVVVDGAVILMWYSFEFLVLMYINVCADVLKLCNYDCAAWWIGSNNIDALPN